MESQVKIVKMLLLINGLGPNDIKVFAQEIHALRYQIAREVLSEWKEEVYPEYGYYSLHQIKEVLDWLGQQEQP